MAPAHVGLLTTGKVQKEDIAAQIIHLAVGGHLRVTPIEQPAGRWGRKGGRAWRLDRTTADPSSLEPTRRALLEALFCDGPSVTLGDASTRVTGSVEALRERLVEEARTAGWVDKNPARGVYTVLAVAAWLAFAVTGFMIFESPPLWVIVVAFAGFMAFGILRTVTPENRTTSSGDTLGQECEAFATYLRSGDGRLLAGPRGAEVFGRHLPWAVATGTAREWSDTFARTARSLSATDRAAVQAWGRRSPGSAESGSPARPRTWPTVDPRWGGDSVPAGEGVTDPGFGGFGDTIGGFVDSMGDFADSVGDFADDLGSDLGNSGGGDGGGGDGGDGGGGGD